MRDTNLDTDIAALRALRSRIPAEWPTDKDRAAAALLALSSYEAVAGSLAPLLADAYESLRAELNLAHQQHDDVCHQAADLKKQLADLKAFKDYVHGRLDAAGVTKQPDGPHSKEGCRIGDRLDVLIGMSSFAPRPCERCRFVKCICGQEVKL